MANPPQPIDFEEAVRLIVREDPRFDAAAYLFIRDALDHTVRALRKQTPASPRQGNHVSGRELMEGVRDFALQQYGPLAFTVLDYWRVRSCADFGDIVFNLIEFGVFSKTDTDSREDFAQVFDFHEALLRPFEPSRKSPVRESSND
jgi:uncharacterized repeat protein (TIGR04138 family)